MISWLNIEDTWYINQTKLKTVLLFFRQQLVYIHVHVFEISFLMTKKRYIYHAIIWIDGVSYIRSLTIHTVILLQQGRFAQPFGPRRWRDGPGLDSGLRVQDAKGPDVYMCGGCGCAMLPHGRPRIPARTSAHAEWGRGESGKGRREGTCWGEAYHQ